MLDLSVFPALIVFSAVALVVAAAYLVLTWLSGLLARLAKIFRCSPPVSCRPGEVVHQALKITGRRWDRYRTAALLFCVSLALLLSFGRTGWWPDLAPALWAGAGAVVCLFVAVATWLMLRLSGYRRRLKWLLDAHIEIAQRLQEAQLRGNRIYHAVPVGDAVIDHIVVGSQGVYTINLVYPPLKSCTSVEFKRNGLLFMPGAHRNDLVSYRKALVALAKELTNCAGAQVTVQPVVIIPGCRIEETPEDGPLLVSMESCTAFVGWKNREAFLMEDEVARIDEWLSRQTHGQQSRPLRKLAAALRAELKRPAEI